MNTFSGQLSSFISVWWRQLQVCLRKRHEPKRLTIYISEVQSSWSLLFLVPHLAPVPSVPQSAPTDEDDHEVRFSVSVWRVSMLTHWLRSLIGNSLAIAHLSCCALRVCHRYSRMLGWEMIEEAWGVGVVSRTLSRFRFPTSCVLLNQPFYIWTRYHFF